MKLLDLDSSCRKVFFASQAVAAFDRDGTSSGERYVARNCAWCHGTSVQGFSTAPRLAGQQERYIEAQILDFRSHSRDNPSSKLYMWGAAAPLSRPWHMKWPPTWRH